MDNAAQIVIYEKDGEPITTSLTIAEVYEKRHGDVLRSIENLECSEEFMRRNFASHTYIDSRGNKQPMFEMKEAGCMRVVMRFTGPKAGETQDRIAEEFYRMRDHINKSRDTAITNRNDASALLAKLTDVAIVHDRQMEHIVTVQNNIRGDVNDLKSDMSDAKVQIKQIKEANNRKGFSLRSKKIYGAVVVENGSLCPCCQTTLLPPMEYDHWFNKPSKNKLNEGWAICPECHKQFTHSKWTRPEKRPFFDAFQARVSEFLKRQGYLFNK